MTDAQDPVMTLWHVPSPSGSLEFCLRCLKCTHFQKGAIHKLRRQAWGGGFAKCLCYYISLCSKLQKSQNLVYVVCVGPQSSVPHINILLLIGILLHWIFVQIFNICSNIQYLDSNIIAERTNNYRFHFLLALVF